jgi:hypothetical protein
LTKTKEYKDRYFWKSGRGFRERKVATAFVDTLSTGDGTQKWPLLLAPCKLKIQRATVNAITYPHGTSDGSCTITLYKTAADGDTALSSGLALQGDTDEETQNLTLSTKDVDEGVMVYMQSVVAGTLGTAAADVIFQVEYRHNEN